MDKGEFIKVGYTVEPGNGGSFVVVRGGSKWKHEGWFPEVHGFTSHEDLIGWLADEHRALAMSNAGKNEPASETA